MMSTTQKIGMKLRWLREQRNLSLNDVAIRTNKAKQTIYKYEMGMVDISVSTLQILLDVYGVNVGKFLDEI
jgi:transcriptional regulator with XRE-family HTH domain